MSGYANIFKTKNYDFRKCHLFDLLIFVWRFFDNYPAKSKIIGLIEWKLAFIICYVQFFLEKSQSHQTSESFETLTFFMEVFLLYSKITLPVLWFSVQSRNQIFLEFSLVYWTRPAFWALTVFQTVWVFSNPFRSSHFAPIAKVFLCFLIGNKHV